MTNDYYMIDTKKLKRLMKEEDYTTTQLAVLAKIPYSSLREILNGTTKNPKKETMLKIAVVLQVYLEEITNDADD